MKMIMVLCSLFIFCATAHAQSPMKSSSNFAERDGRFGLLFSFDGLILSGINGGVGGKYWLSNQWAAIGSLDLGYSRSESGPGTARTSQIGLSAGVERHLLSSRFSPYIGGAAGYRYSLVKSESTQSTRYSETDRHIVSASLNLGVELWVMSSLSLAGQYGFALEYVRDKSGTYGGSSPANERTVERNRINLGQTSVVVSAYF